MAHFNRERVRNALYTQGLRCLWPFHLHNPTWRNTPPPSSSTRRKATPTFIRCSTVGGKRIGRYRRDRRLCAQVLHEKAIGIWSAQTSRLLHSRSLKFDDFIHTQNATRNQPEISDHDVDSFHCRRNRCTSHNSFSDRGHADGFRTWTLQQPHFQPDQCNNELFYVKYHSRRNRNKNFTGEDARR